MSPFPKQQDHLATLQCLLQDGKVIVPLDPLARLAYTKLYFPKTERLEPENSPNWKGKSSELNLHDFWVPC